MERPGVRRHYWAAATATRLQAGLAWSLSGRARAASQASMTRLMQHWKLEGTGQASAAAAATAKRWECEAAAAGA